MAPTLHPPHPPAAPVPYSRTPSLLSLLFQRDAVDKVVGGDDQELFTVHL